MVMQSQIRGRADWKYLKPGDLRQFKNMLFAARTIVEGAYTGRHKSPFKGSSQEFTDFREYYPGDDIRAIDWKVHARTDRYYIKVFEKETDMTCYLLLDGSASMGFGGANYDRYFPAASLSKFEYACFLAAAIAYLAVKQGDRAGLTIFDQQVRKHLPAGGSFSHLYRLLNALELREPAHQTSISQTLRATFPLFRRRGMLFVISDFHDEMDDIFDALNMYRHRGFEVVLLQVLHQYELTLPPLANANFIDAETAERLTTAPGDIRESYERLVREFTETLAEQAAARAIDYQLLSTETPFNVGLEKYLQRRAAR